MATVRIRCDTSEVVDLAADLGRVPGRLNRKIGEAVEDTAQSLEQKWKANAQATSGAHGVHYPSAIEARSAGYLTWEIKPNAGMPQGGMSFEYGSRNQPPHLDGNRAADAELPGFFRRVYNAVDVDL